MPDIPWNRDTILFYRGQTISTLEENGRRFWAVSIPDPCGWSLRQEFAFTSEATHYIDHRLGAGKAA